VHGRKTKTKKTKKTQITHLRDKLDLHLRQVIGYIDCVFSGVGGEMEVEERIHMEVKIKQIEKRKESSKGLANGFLGLRLQGI
jgi:hypothetical protein